MNECSGGHSNSLVVGARPALLPYIHRADSQAHTDQGVALTNE